jgi:hypothetical protein
MELGKVLYGASGLRVSANSEPVEEVSWAVH